MSKTLTRPEECEDKHLEYLDELRESGVTNMLGASSYLEREFPELCSDRASFHSSDKARNVLSYWTQTFGDSTR